MPFARSAAPRHGDRSDADIHVDSVALFHVELARERARLREASRPLDGAAPQHGRVERGDVRVQDVRRDEEAEREERFRRAILQACLGV